MLCFYHSYLITNVAYLYGPFWIAKCINDVKEKPVKAVLFFVVYTEKRKQKQI